MKKLLVCFLLGMMVLFTGQGTLLHFNTPYIVKAQPAYAKWGRLAMLKTKEKYPNAQIIDYLHIGRVKGENTSIEKFKLWLKEKDKEFGVLVDIEFETKSEKMTKITYKEVKN